MEYNKDIETKETSKKGPVAKEIQVNEAQVEYVRHYTYDDYMSWDDDKRWEIIDGIPFVMTAPTVQHQEISGNIYLQLRKFLEGKQCKVFYAPFDVRLNAEINDDTVVQPDIIIICDHSIMDKTGCKGAPDMVVEILSPSSGNSDTVVKLNLYQKTGVREYWIIDPETRLTHVYILENGHYHLSSYTETNIIQVHILSGCTINMTDVFV